MGQEMMKEAYVKPHSVDAVGCTRFVGAAKAFLRLYADSAQVRCSATAPQYATLHYINAELTTAVSSRDRVAQFPTTPLRYQTFLEISSVANMQIKRPNTTRTAVI